MVFAYLSFPTRVIFGHRVPHSFNLVMLESNPVDGEVKYFESPYSILIVQSPALIPKIAYELQCDVGRAS